MSGTSPQEILDTLVCIAPFVELGSSHFGGGRVRLVYADCRGLGLF